MVLALGVTSGIAAAQTVGGADDQPPEVAPAADETPPTPPPDTSEALGQCVVTRTILAEIAHRLRLQLDTTETTCATEIADTRQDFTIRLNECDAARERTRVINVALNDRMRACEERPQQDPDLLQALADAEAGIAALEARLAELGYSAQAGFDYVGGDAVRSFATAGDLPRLLRGLPRLAEADCGDALDWLDAQEGPNRPLLRVIWVWRHDQPLLCARDRTGAPAPHEARANDEAHAIVFQ